MYMVQCSIIGAPSSQEECNTANGYMGIYIEKIYTTSIEIPIDNIIYMRGDELGSYYLLHMCSLCNIDIYILCNLFDKYTSGSSTSFYYVFGKKK